MRLVTTYLNAYIELLEGAYGSERHDQLRTLLRLYNRLVGPVTMVDLVRPGLLDLTVYSTACAHAPLSSLICDLTVKGDRNPAPIPGGGKGASELTALLGAFGEITERLLAVFHTEAVLDRLVYASYEQLVHQGRRALGPDEMPLFAPEQHARPNFGYAPFRPDTFLSWMEGNELLSGEPVLVPAQLVLMYYRLHPEELPISYATSAGLACHTSRQQGILHGLYEVIERDGLNIHWYCKIPPPCLKVDLTAFLADYWNIRCTRMSTPYLQDVQIFLNTLDIPIPVCTGIAVDQSRPDRVFLGGSGAAMRREQALAQTLFEIGQSQSAYRLDPPFGRSHVRADSDVSELTEFFDAELYYGFACNLPRVAWYRSGGRIVPWEDMPTYSFAGEAEEYAAALDWLRATRLNPIVFDLTGASWPGVSITKVLVPQVTQASIPSHPPLGHPRFYELPQRLGLADRVLTFEDLNPDPAPLP